MFFNPNDTLQLLLLVLTINVLVTTVSLIIALKLAKDKNPRLRVAGYTLLPVGLIALLSSIVLESTVLALIGLGFTFWGVLLLYITNESYIKQGLLGTTTISSLKNLNQILNEIKYRGATTYLPSKYFNHLETIKIYILKNKNNNLPKPEEVQRQEGKTFLINPEATGIPDELWKEGAVPMFSSGHRHSYGKVRVDAGDDVKLVAIDGRISVGFET